jgi:hypothetical protein
MDMRWLPVLVLGLVVAGCSTTTEQQPPATSQSPPPPPADRVLVTWSDKVCGQAKQLDDLHTQVDRLNGQEPDMVASSAQSLLLSATRDVESAAKVLKDLAPSKIEAVDAHVAALVKVLEGLRPQLPSADDRTLYLGTDEEKLAKAKDVGALIVTIERQVPKLTALAESTPGLAPSYNLAPSCDPVKQHDQRARELVVWSDSMCQTVSRLAGLRTDPLSDPSLVDPRFAQFASVQLSQYIESQSYPVEQVQRTLSALKPIGIAAADDYRSAMLTGVDEALPKLPKSRGLSRPDELPVEELKRQATEVAEVLTSLKPKEPGLGAIARGNPELGTAYGLAPACEPPKPPATAANGTDIASCQSGKCQIQVNGSIDLTVNSLSFTIKVASPGITVTHDMGILQLGAGSEGSFSSDGKAVRFVVSSVSGTTAVVEISS